MGKRGEREKSGEGCFKTDLDWIGLDWLCSTEDEKMRLGRPMIWLTVVYKKEAKSSAWITS